MSSQNDKPKIVGQISTVHSSDEALQAIHIDQHLDRMRESIPLDILVLGWNEKRELFNHLTHPETRKSDQVYLWYPFLSDYPEMTPDHLVINLNGEKSRGWGGYAGTGIRESFQQACPNNPSAIATSLKHLERLLTGYNFDGAFIDKIRFPSPANGFAEIFSCFCEHCAGRAAQYSLDLEEVKYALRSAKTVQKREPMKFSSGEKAWLDELLANQPVLQHFVNFRMDSINQVLIEIDALLKKIDKKFALDVFSPSLAPLVGQDFRFMSALADWVKPMIYRFGHGPSSLRSEIPGLIYGLQDYLGLDLEEIMQFMRVYVKGLENVSIEEIKKTAPLRLIQAETDLAVNQLDGTQVYLGLETVFIANKMEIKPEDIREILNIGENSGVDGYVLSWDLLHTPIDNVIPIRALT